METKYKVLDNMPIVTQQEVEQIQDPKQKLTFDAVANEQALRYPKGHSLEGRLVLDVNGKVQYRRTLLSNKPQENLDMRQAAREYYYISPELQAEIDGKPLIIKDQSL